MAAQGRIRTAEADVNAPKVRRRMRPRALRATDVAHESPAAALQAQLAQTWAEGPAGEIKWSARRSLAFMLLFNGVFWAGLGVVIANVIRASH